MAFKEFFSLFSHFKVLLLCGLATDSPPLRARGERERDMHILISLREERTYNCTIIIFFAICIYASEHVQRAQNSSNMKRELFVGHEKRVSLASLIAQAVIAIFFSYYLIIHIVFQRLNSLLSALFFPSTTSLYCTWIILRVFTTTSLQNSIISYVRKNHDLSQWYSQK